MYAAALVVNCGPAALNLKSILVTKVLFQGIPGDIHNIHIEEQINIPWKYLKQSIELAFCVSIPMVDLDPEQLQVVHDSSAGLRGWMIPNEFEVMFTKFYRQLVIARLASNWYAMASVESVLGVSFAMSTVQNERTEEQRVQLVRLGRASTKPVPRQLAELRIRDSRNLVAAVAVAEPQGIA